MVEISVLGPIQGIREGEEVDLGGPTQRRLLAALVARPGEIVPVTTLLGDLWGDDPPPSGPQSIQSYVSRLRRQLGGEVIETKAPGYRLEVEHVDLDSTSFLDMISRLPRESVERLEHIDQALALWNGPAFENFEHVEFAARHLEDTRLSLQEERAQLLADLGRTQESVAALEKITATAPLRETAWLELSRVLGRSGRQAEAVRTLDRYRENLAEIGLEPGPAFGEAQDEAFETKPDIGPRSNLPRVETSFLGREREMERLRDSLAENRLVTITGPGGMGKTRLAIEALAGWPDSPVVLAPLASLADDRDVAPAVLNAVAGETRGDPVMSIVSRLSPTPTLLLLDNAEHVIEAVADLISEILMATPTQVLVTSREPLNMDGELILNLDALDPPSAIELYRDRASQVDPKFDASPATLDILCEELDYMPLAIEMAAARSSALSAEEILARLSRRFGLLDRPRRGGAERHRSLDALVDWSYGLLDPTGQSVFQRLSIIAGTFDLDLATAVAGFGEVQSEMVAGTLADLVDKSLVRRITNGRFRMLRVLRSFAFQKLLDGADLAATRAAHARWFADLSTEIGEGLSTPDETIWIERANASVEDLDEALKWAVEMHELGVAQQILEGLFDWFYHRQPPAITDWGDQALPVSEGHDLNSVASAWTALARMKEGEIESARNHALTGTSVEGPAGRFAWFMTGEVACYQDRLPDALDAYRRQLVRASNLDDRIGVVDALAGETLALAFQGVFDRAIDIASDLEQRAREIGAPTYKAYSRYALGEAVVESDPERAADLLTEAIEIAASVNNHFIQGMASTTLGSVLANLGRFDEAIETLHRAMAVWEGMGMPAYQWTVVQFLGAVLAETGRRESAGQLLAAAETAGRRPFSAGQSHWVATVDDLKAEPRYEDWATVGSRMSLEMASRHALEATGTPTRLRR